MQSRCAALDQPPPALKRQLDLAARGLRAVREGKSAREVTAAWPRPLRPGASALLFHALRHAGLTQALTRQLVTKPAHPHVQALLMVSLAILADPQLLGYQPFTVVDQSVQALREHKRLAGQAGFLNACLRRYIREAETLQQAVAADPQARWNHPEWWIGRLQRDYPAQWQAILAANNSRAPMALRVNTARITRSDYLQALSAQGVAATPVGQQGLVLHHPADVRTLAGYAEGWFSVQDTGAQYAAAWLLQAPLPATSGTLRILDACAAPGGKTGHLMELAATQGVTLDLVAMEKDAARAQRITENLTRLGFAEQVRIVVADATAPAGWPPEIAAAPFDAILLDAPCSASGIVRRHPDVRWLRREDDIAALARQQQTLLAQLWPTLRSGGRLLYCTCSVFREEGLDQIERFLPRQTDARLIAALQLLPAAPEDAAPHSRDDAAPAMPHASSRHLRATADHSAAVKTQTGEHDGFFYALLEKA